MTVKIQPDDYAGYILLARRLQTSPIWLTKPADWLKGWLLILFRCRYQETGNLKRGQGFFAYKSVSPWLPGMTRDQWNHLVTWLRSQGAISTTRTPRGLLITVTLYNEYQDPTTYQSSSAATDPAYSDKFITFSQRYPVQRAIEAAAKEWGRAIRRANPETILAGVDRLNDALLHNIIKLEYVPFPGRWLADRRWTDIYSKSKHPPKQAPGSNATAKEKPNRDLVLRTLCDQLWELRADPKQTQAVLAAAEPQSTSLGKRDGQTVIEEAKEIVKFWKEKNKA